MCRYILGAVHSRGSQEPDMRGAAGHAARRPQRDSSVLLRQLFLMDTVTVAVGDTPCVWSESAAMTVRSL